MSKETQDLQKLSAMWAQSLYHVLYQEGKIPFRVSRRIRGPQTLTYRLMLFQTKDLSKVLGMGERVGLALGTDTPRLARNGRYVDVEVPLASRYRVVLPVSALRRMGRAWVTLGQKPEGQAVSINLAGTFAPHWLVAAQTGAGKTVALKLALYQLAEQNPQERLNLLVVDGKGGMNYQAFANEAHLTHPLIVDPSEATRALAWTLAELDARKRDGRKSPRLVLVVDEIAEVLDLAGDKAGEAIRRVSALGRELGINVLAATQHPTSKVLGGSLAKANMGLRLVGRVADANASYLCTGQKGAGAELLRGAGDFLVVAGGNAHRLQVGLVTDDQIAGLPKVDETPRLPLEDLDLDRALSIGPEPQDDDQNVALDAEAVAYALATGCGCPTLRERYGPMGTKRARRIRDFAKALRDALTKLGYAYPLPLTQLSAETAHRVGITPQGVTG